MSVLFCVFKCTAWFIELTHTHTHTHTQPLLIVGSRAASFNGPYFQSTFLSLCMSVCVNNFDDLWVRSSMDRDVTVLKVVAFRN